MSAIDDTVGMKNVLEKFRQHHQLTYRAMAAMTHGLVAFQVVFDHCQGKKRISAESALKYHQAFGIPLSDLRPDLWPPEPSGHEPYRQDGEGA